MNFNVANRCGAQFAKFVFFAERFLRKHPRDCFLAVWRALKKAKPEISEWAGCLKVNHLSMTVHEFRDHFSRICCTILTSKFPLGAFELTLN